VPLARVCNHNEHIDEYGGDRKIVKKDRNRRPNVNNEVRLEFGEEVYRWEERQRWNRDGIA
jgi:hypothetical protein